MPFYAPPLYDNVNVRLEGGYIPPSAVGGEKTLSPIGRYDYKPSHYNNVNAYLTSGYILPNPVGQSKSLSRTEHSGALPQTISVIGTEHAEIGLNRVDLKISYVLPNGVEYTSIGNLHIRNAVEKIYVNHDYIPKADMQVNLSGNYQISTSAVLNRRGNYGFFGFSSINNVNKEVISVGIKQSEFGLSTVILAKRTISVSGFLTSLFGTPLVKDTSIHPFGINSLIFSNLIIYNLRQYVKNNSFNSTVFGSAYVQGGVKFVVPNGLFGTVWGANKVINTRATQYVVAEGISSFTVPNPIVSPRFIITSGIIGTIFGVPFVQRNPSPKGFINTKYGIAWISHSPRYIMAKAVESYISGYPKVFDPTQNIYVSGVNTIITGGVFGDIAIRNHRRVLKVSGFDSYQFGDWSVVESNLRNIHQKGVNAQIFGDNAIRNKTPSIIPIGISSFSGINSSIGYRIRNVKPSGLYQPKFGIPTFTKPPELKPISIYSSAFGTSWISHKNRIVSAGFGSESLIFGGINVWHYTRYLKLNGVIKDEYGIPRIEHGRRTLLVKGSLHSAYGNIAWLSYAVRSIVPPSIDYPKIPNHRVGGTQHVHLNGYVATLFGNRIIPDSHTIYMQGFSNVFGLADVNLWKKYIKPNGFLTIGQDAGHRFGTAKFWNLRQYIIQFYDGNSGLVPPLWTGWTNINNRNKSIGAIGGNFTRIAEPTIENKARPILPSGFDSSSIISKSMIADRVRNLKLQGIDTPYISSWSVIFNAAAVLASKGFNSQSFGIASIINTRRYFNRIGNFESLEVGKPMVADRIRTLKFEQRYTISPPYIPIHRIDLHTRYIDEVGRFDNHQAFGNPSLSIHWNMITPRWTLRDAYGTPVVKNITPELGTRGRNSEEFGQTNIRTQWRELLHLGSQTVAWGRTEIAFRDRQFSVSGFTQWAIPRHTVTKTGVPPYYPQYIWLDEVEIDGKQNNGHGIEIPERQVAFPSVKSNAIFPIGFVASSYGSHYTQSNGILVQPGLQELTIGDHFIGLKNRTITVPTIGDLLQIQNAKPRISPWTIWATEDTPNQAKLNHSDSKGTFHPLNSNGGTRPAGEIFGNLNISLLHRKFPIGMGNQSSFGNGHKIDLKQRYIVLKDFGFRSQRIGFHVVGPFDQNVMQFDSNDMQGFGWPSLSIPYRGAFFIKPNGLNFPTFNRPTVDFFNRTIKALGSNHLQMGTIKSGDKPYMWQGLRVGELIKGNYGGFENEVFGNTFISLKVRNLEAQGFESFVMEYDYTQFDKRMRVVRQELPKPKLLIKPVGVDALFVTVPNIKPAVHYIRPDGNADQFRKGAF